MDGNCLSECLIYKASVSASTNKYYYGTCENTFKEHCNNHKCCFRNKSPEKTLNCPSMYGNWKRKILIILLIGILLWKRRNMFVDLESVIYAFVRSSLFQEQILTNLSQNVNIEISLLWSALKIDKKIYNIRCMELYLFFFLGVNIAEYHLMIGDMKHSAMVIYCCQLPPIYIRLLCFT